MIDKLTIKNMGPINNLTWDNLSNINILVGENGTGKTIALKALFSALKSLEEQGVGNDNRLLKDILSEKLYWTFQPGEMGLGALVNNHNNEPLSFSMQENEKEFNYSFGKDTRKAVRNVDSSFVAPRESNSVFVPASEILSKYQIILKSREQDRVFGFDDTEYSLVKVMQFPFRNEISQFSLEAVAKLQEFDGGKLTYNSKDNAWKFVSEKTEIPLGMLSEGVRKLTVIERLLSINYIRPGSTVIIDEVENSLHPRALCDFIDIILQLASSGIQFFISTHSYIAIKKFYVLAKEKGISIPTASIARDNITFSNLKDGLPENEIIKSSNEIYEKEVDLMFRSSNG